MDLARDWAGLAADPDRVGPGYHHHLPDAPRRDAGVGEASCGSRVTRRHMRPSALGNPAIGIWTGPVMETQVGALGALEKDLLAPCKGSFEQRNGRTDEFLQLVDIARQPDGYAERLIFIATKYLPRGCGAHPLFRRAYSLTTIRLVSSVRVIDNHCLGID